MWRAQTQGVYLRSRTIFTKSLTCLIAAALMFSNSVLAQTATEIEAPINLTIGTQLKAPFKIVVNPLLGPVIATTLPPYVDVVITSAPPYVDVVITSAPPYVIITLDPVSTGIISTVKWLGSFVGW